MSDPQALGSAPITAPSASDALARVPGSSLAHPTCLDLEPTLSAPGDQSHA
jgi:hypothetical protein